MLLLDRLPRPHMTLLHTGNQPMHRQLLQAFSRATSELCVAPSYPVRACWAAVAQPETLLLPVLHSCTCCTGQHHHTLPKSAVVCNLRGCCSCYSWPGVQQQVAGTVSAGPASCSSTAAGQCYCNRSSGWEVNAAAVAIMQVRHVVAAASVHATICSRSYR
jgi:hypothetical protein